MCSPAQPAAPAAPDYAKANQAGVQANIDALPQQNAINAAATLGTVYTDPTTGKVSDFTGLGQTDIANQQLEQQLSSVPKINEALLNIQKQYGPQFAQIARDNLRVTDPNGFNLRDAFGGSLLTGGKSISSLAGNSQAPTYEQLSGNGPAMQSLQQSDAPQFQTVDGMTLSDTGASAAGRSQLERQVFDRLAQTGQSDPSLTRATEQAARARGASSGNLMGDGSAMQEALAVQKAQVGLDQGRRADALGLLESGQTTSDKGNELAQQNFNNAGTVATFNNGAAQQSFQNKGLVNEQQNAAGNQAFQNAMASVGQRNQALQNSFASQQAAAQQQMGARQQDIANIQSYLGLSPIVAQGGMLSGLQQGAAPTTSGTGYQNMGVNANAGQLGSSFAGNVFGTQASIFGQQSQAASQGGILNTMGKVAGIAGGLGSAYSGFGLGK